MNFYQELEEKSLEFKPGENLDLTYRYLKSMNYVRYDTFELNGSTNVELMLNTHCSTENVVVE